MSNYIHRLKKLETALNFSATGDCTCSARPPYAVTARDPEGHDLPSDPAEAAKLDFTCPIHGKVGPELDVRVIQFCHFNPG